MKQEPAFALRVHLYDGSGFDLTEQGTQKSLAVYVVRDPRDVPGIARLGPDPLTRRSPSTARRDPSVAPGPRSRGCSATVRDRRDRQRLQRRGAARRQMSLFKLAGTSRPPRAGDPARNHRRDAARRRRPFPRPPEASNLKSEKKSWPSGACPAWGCGAWCAGTRCWRVVVVHSAPVLPDLPDRWQAPADRRLSRLLK